MKKEHLVIAGSALGIALIAALFMTGELTFAALTLARVSQILTNLLFVALVVERALEVYITAYRQPGRASFDVNIKRISKEIGKVKAMPDGTTLAGGTTKEDKLLELTAELKPHEEELETYKSHTGVLALRAGLVLGLLTAAVGYRALGAVVDAGALTGFQTSAYAFIDVLLTGGLLAGGSKGIHSLTQVFGNYLDTMAEGAKATS
jgi:hypothetical protein